MVHCYQYFETIYMTRTNVNPVVVVQGEGVVLLLTHIPVKLIYRDI